MTNNYMKDLVFNNLVSLLINTKSNMAINSYNISTSINSVKILCNGLGVDEFISDHGLDLRCYNTWLNCKYFKTIPHCTDNSITTTTLLQSIMVDKYVLEDFSDIMKLRKIIDDWFIKECGKTLEYDLSSIMHLITACISKYTINLTKPFDNYKNIMFNNSLVEGMTSTRLCKTHENNFGKSISFDLDDNYYMSIFMPKDINMLSINNTIQHLLYNNMKEELIKLHIPLIDMDITIDSSLDLGKYVEYTKHYNIEEDYGGHTFTFRTLFKLDKDQLSSECLSVLGTRGCCGPITIKEFNVDKPFLFFVVDKTNKFPQISGKIIKL